jgi:hypothetical protein
MSNGFVKAHSLDQFDSNREHCDCDMSNLERFQRSGSGDHVIMIRKWADGFDKNVKAQKERNPFSGGSSEKCIRSSSWAEII